MGEVLFLLAVLVGVKIEGEDDAGGAKLKVPAGDDDAVVFSNDWGYICVGRNRGARGEGFVGA